MFFLLFFLCITLLCVLCVVLLLCCVVCCFGVCIMLCVCGRCTSDVCNAAAPSALITWPPIFLYFSHRPHQQSIFDIWYLITWPPIFLYFSHRSHLQSIFDIWYLIMCPPIFFYFSHRPHQQSIVNLSAKLDHVTFNFSNKVFTLNDMIWSLIIWSSVYLTIKSSDYQNIWSSTDPPCIKTLPKAQQTRGLSSAYQSSNTNLDQIPSSESPPNNFKISTKNQHLYSTQKLKYWPNLASESRPRFNLI